MYLFVGSYIYRAKDRVKIFFRYFERGSGTHLTDDLCVNFNLFLIASHLLTKKSSNGLRLVLFTVTVKSVWRVTPVI